MGGSAQLHTSSPQELAARIDAERRGTPFLIYRDGAGRQQLFDLDEAPARLSIGRHPASDLALTWDAEASRLHAELERIAGEWTVIDDGRARNGTFVNERRVAGRTLLLDGDVVRIGNTRLTFRAPLMASASTTAAPSSWPVTVSPAQRRVLVSLCRPVFMATSFAAPASNREIAADLVVSLETVRTHIRHLFEALEIEPAPQNQKRAALARAAIERGVVTQHDFERTR